MRSDVEPPTSTDENNLDGWWQDHARQLKGESVMEHTPAIRELQWSGAIRPLCPVRGCSLASFWVIRIPTKSPGRGPDRGLGEPWSREAQRCDVHGREWADKHNLPFPGDWKRNG